MEPVPDIIYPARRDARMQLPGECDGGICLSSPAQQTQPDRKFIISMSLFSLPIMPQFTEAKERWKFCGMMPERWQDVET